MNNLGSNGDVNHTPSGRDSVSDGRHISNGDVSDVGSRNANRLVSGGVSIGEAPYASDAVVTDVGNGDVNRTANGNLSNGSVTRLGNGNLSISDRLARAANSQDRGRQFYLFFERYRFILLNGQRDDRRHITRDRVLLQQLQVFLVEIEGLPDSVLVSRSLALLRALIAIVEQRIRAYARNVADASRMASLVMDYLDDVMRM
ncbi:hypothetical protein CTI12_AA533060 [Artemisia annua]|uniref:Uncharacterized protein n=1 Tax=Artemisia annua TaxID=35608 RepID=A0A2U1L408_ARTAN|nr:hypothetical protein CTI12_AA533060 [Artemisia annua]